MLTTRAAIFKVSQTLGITKLNSLDGERHGDRTCETVAEEGLEHGSKSALKTARLKQGGTESGAIELATKSGWSGC